MNEKDQNLNSNNYSSVIEQTIPHILEIKNLEIDYGIVKAIRGVNMIIPRGSIVAILGANGAGKTSIIKAISGMTKVSKGSIIYAGHIINNLAPYKIVKKGIMQSPEGRLILTGLTVEENLMIGAYTIKKEVTLNSVISRKRRVAALLEEVYNYFPILKERRKQQASTLSGGEQQMLAIGRALMAKPELLLLDEPSLGLAPLVIKDIFNIIQKIKEDGRTILIVEQNAKQTLKIADYGYVLEIGKVKIEGVASQLLNNDELTSAYLGKAK
jgi:branched-chain amino acid transport system ATP-binding protein